MSHIFISYSRKDIDFARYLRATLENIGFGVWMDEERLSAGMNWSDELQKAIDNCSAFVVVMSPDSQNSKFVQSEILHAIDRKKPMFPVLLVGEPFFLLKAYQYEDMRGGLGDKVSDEFINNLKGAMGVQVLPSRKIRFEIIKGNVLSFSSDVLILKYARKFFGADLQVAQTFLVNGDIIDEMSLKRKEHVLRETNGLIGSQHVLYVPTVGPKQFSYSEIRSFTEKSFTILAKENVEMKHVAMTIHGMGFGLDEHHAVMAQIGGILDVLQSDILNLDIERISIIELSDHRTERLQKAVEVFFDEASYAQRDEDVEWGYDLVFGEEKNINTPDAGQDDVKPYALAILPDDEALEDIFYYGIQRPSHAMGLLCERIKLAQPDDESQAIETLDSILQRIGQAKIVVCDVSQITPMLYLKLGYAWGKNVPTALITQSDKQYFDEAQYIEYQKIWELEERLSQWLKQTLA